MAGLQPIKGLNRLTRRRHTAAAPPAKRERPPAPAPRPSRAERRRQGRA